MASTQHKATTRAGKYVEKEMHKFKHGTKTARGTKVQSRKQAIAIGLSEARQKGIHVPKKKSRSRRVSH